MVELENVFFETGKFDLKPESKAELNKLVSWMKLNPLVKIEIGGHTDNVGDKNQIVRCLIIAQSLCTIIYLQMELRHPE